MSEVVNGRTLKKRCQGTSKRSGKQCKKPAMKGRNVCRIHGGATPRGKASPHYRHGRFSKHVPENMRLAYHEYLEDKERTDNDDTLSLIDARIAVLMGRVDTGESGHAWRLARDHMQKYREAEAGLVPKDRKREYMEAALAGLEAAIAEGVSDQEGWAEVSKLWELRRKMSETQMKRDQQLAGHVKLEQVLVLMDKIVALISDNISNEMERILLQEAILRLAGGEPETIDGEYEMIEASV